MSTPIVAYTLRLADDALVLGHRLSEWTSRAPTLEEEMALANIALDLIGQARALYTYAGEAEGRGRTEDDLAYFRGEAEFGNLLLNELPNGDFAFTIARQLLVSAFMLPFWTALTGSRDATLAAIAAKAEKEVAYHLRHAAEWTVRLGDGTDESRVRMIAALDELWPWTGEMFEMDGPERALVEAGVAVDRERLRDEWSATVGEALAEAGLDRPRDGWMQTGGRRGLHTEHLGHMLAVMQSLARAHPGATW
ncbi:1,2-phenylacetyl-CoA epoxidase subunit PaaC [Prosthecomicrobium sp. N25]|uniref:1,2-phenylacetyl-CoA epoxidase subunit PaaC n=1 Tax=Prosthecomicrobium sp. N25 TaxID=3129254 RepID=UPI003077F8F1